MFERCEYNSKRIEKIRSLSEKQREELAYLKFNLRCVNKETDAYCEKVIRENIEYSFEQLDELKVPFSLQNFVIANYELDKVVIGV